MRSLSDKTYIIAGLWLPQANIFGREAHDISGFIDDTCSGATCANIDADIVVHLEVDFISRIRRVRSTGRSAALRLAEGNRRRHRSGSRWGVFSNKKGSLY